MTKPTDHDAFNAQLERAVKGAREANGDDFLRDLDDLAPARPLVWMLWIFAVFAVAMVITGCGGGIDTADEFMGPPEPTARVDAPRPCPVDVSACHPKPTPG